MLYILTSVLQLESVLLCSCCSEGENPAFSAYDCQYLIRDGPNGYQLLYDPRFCASEKALLGFPLKSTLNREKQRPSFRSSVPEMPVSFPFRVDYSCPCWFKQLPKPTTKLFESSFLRARFTQWLSP